MVQLSETGNPRCLRVFILRQTYDGCCDSWSMCSPPSKFSVASSGPHFFSLICLFVCRFSGWVFSFMSFTLEFPPRHILFPMRQKNNKKPTTDGTNSTRLSQGMWVFVSGFSYHLFISGTAPVWTLKSPTRYLQEITNLKGRCAMICNKVKDDSHWGVVNDVPLWLIPPMIFTWCFEVWWFIFISVVICW